MLQRLRWQMGGMSVPVSVRRLCRNLRWAWPLILRRMENGHGLGYGTFGERLWNAWGAEGGRSGLPTNTTPNTTGGRCEAHYVRGRGGDACLHHLNLGGAGRGVSTVAVRMRGGGCGRGGSTRQQWRRILAQRGQVRRWLVAQSGLRGRGRRPLATSVRPVIRRGVGAAAVVIVDVRRLNVHIVRTLGVGQLLFDTRLELGI